MTDTKEIIDESVNAVNPELSQIRSICDLATLECYYHNVAKFGADISKVNI